MGVGLLQVDFLSVVGAPLDTMPGQCAYIIELTLVPCIVRQFHTFRKNVGGVSFERCSVLAWLVVTVCVYTLYCLSADATIGWAAVISK